MTERAAGRGEDMGLRTLACLMVSRPHVLYVLSNTEEPGHPQRERWHRQCPQDSLKDTAPALPALPPLQWGLSQPEGLARPRAELECFIIVFACLR